MCQGVAPPGDDIARRVAGGQVERGSVSSLHSLAGMVVARMSPFGYEPPRASVRFVNGPHSLVGVIVARSLTAGGFPISSGGSLAVRTSVVR
jgi:hypothetical protein